jgi:hypothetical protein
MPKLDDAVLTALLEQHRWERSCERIYRSAFQQKEIDEPCFNDMLRTFGVARNLSDKGKVRLRERLPHVIQLCRNHFNDVDVMFKELLRLGNIGSATRKEVSAADEAVSRLFVSGFTKVLWFGGAHSLPMFDSFTHKAIGIGGGNSIAKATLFYERLNDTWKYAEVHSKLDAVKNILSWDFFAERFIDKILLFHGASLYKNAKPMMASEHAKNAYLCALSENERKEVYSAVQLIHKILQPTPFNVCVCP